MKNHLMFASSFVLFAVWVVLDWVVVWVLKHFQPEDAKHCGAMVTDRFYGNLVFCPKDKLDFFPRAIKDKSLDHALYGWYLVGHCA